MAYVDVGTLERTQKLSAEWFRETARKNGGDAPRRTSRATAARLRFWLGTLAATTEPLVTVDVDQTAG